jgi:TRAP-type C4-dicarboxylate transport system substrate-binding protein
MKLFNISHFKFIVVVSLLLLSILSAEVIKLGTLAVEGSSWAKTFEEMNKALISETNGEVKFKFYFGRDENDLVDLIQNRRIDAISMTSSGLGLILPQIYLFQMPLFFSSYQELDFVRENLSDEFLKFFNKKNYQFLGWGDFGIIYLFSKIPIRTQTDLQRTQFWVRSTDPIAKAFISASGREPILLRIESVLPALQNNQVQTVYNSPLGCIMLQWHSQIKYITDLKLVAGVGATIIDKKCFDRLSITHRKILSQISTKYHSNLISSVRRENEQSLNIILNQGIQLVSVPNLEKKKWQQIAIKVQNQFIGHFYSKELLEKVRTLIKQYQQTE